ncbi:hypothetical protein EW146_g1886 [Bondarzewia mesenterica]|uniref:enoyl-[acyl-carrier-protein] reductase n=1 Tax=Bondarzewia mesenterica TaxID=1095465 RepID=A0A4V3XFX5_9AGAM|nr:hypothetical protein EW146_g1886 [Bondarzewia mesenterica]
MHVISSESPDLSTNSMETSQISSKLFSIPFSRFVYLLSRISKIPPRRNNYSIFERQRDGPYPAQRVFQRWVDKLRDEYSPLPENSTAVVFRLLFPDEDNGRKYQAQEKTLGGQLAMVFSVSTKAEHRGENLRNWNGEHTFGCLGNEVYKVVNATSGDGGNSVGPHSMADVDMLLSELASLCAWSDESVREFSMNLVDRTRLNVLISLYANMPALDAAFLTQIILKDLRPMLYPLTETHYTTSLLDFNSNAVEMLTKEDAMNVWDPSGRMLMAYPVRATLNDAAAFFEDDDGIPKCLKGRGCRQSLRHSDLQTSKKIWAETKYDGERAQIHVQICPNGYVDVKIYSKNARDSTSDRHAVHPTILETLNLIQRPENLPVDQHWPQKNGKISCNVVLEAEMVAFSETCDRIDVTDAEFWHIRSLITSTAAGVRRRLQLPKRKSENPKTSQISLISDGSDDAKRHLALVFFDILVLESESLLSKPYSARRSTLERVITHMHGYALLAERFPIDLRGPNGLAGGEEQLRRIFAKHVADFEEGVVLKADEGRYRDYRFPWVKLKKDYIPGYGDCLDLAVVGAGWDKERARELRVAPSTFTTLYLGVLSNAKVIEKDPSIRPHFEVYFTVSYGQERHKLEKTNFILKSSNYTRYHEIETLESSLDYTFTLSNVQPPTMMLHTPLLVEVYGASFTKENGSNYYELRWPRVTKVHRASERSWREGITFQRFQQIAYECVGRDSADKDVEDEVRSLWGKPTSATARCPVKRTHTIKVWVDNLEEVDGIIKPATAIGKNKEMKPTIPSENERMGETRKRRAAHNDWTANKGRSAVDEGLGNHKENGKDHFGLASMAPPKPRASSSRKHHLDEEVAENTGLNHDSEDHNASGSRNSKRRRLELETAIVQETELRTPSSTLAAQRSNAFTRTLGRPIVTRDPGRSHAVSSTHTQALTRFLEGSLVWFCRPCNNAWEWWRRPSMGIIPDESIIHALDSFLTGCGWNDPLTAMSARANKGVIFMDEHGQVGRKWAEESLALIRERAEDKGVRPAGVRKPIWVFDMFMMRTEALEDCGGDYERFLKAVKSETGFEREVRTRKPILTRDSLKNHLTARWRSSVARALLSCFSTMLSGALYPPIRRSALRAFSTSCCWQANRALVYSKTGPPPDVLTAFTYPKLPAPSAGTLNLRFVLSPINPSDINVIEGVYPVKPQPSFQTVQGLSVFIAGNEGLAEVTNVGEGVDDFQLGDWVVLTKQQAGTWNTATNAHVSEVVRIPRKGNLTEVDAATITVNHPTAYNMLKDFVDLSPGDWVIQNGANSAVGQSVIQIAKSRGIHTINAVRNRENIDVLRRELMDLGATQVVTYDELKDKSARSKVKKWTRGKDIRLGLNCVSGEPATIMARFLGQDAHLVSYGAMSRQPLSLPTSLFIFKNLICHGFWQSRWYKERSRSEREKLVETLVDLMNEGKLGEPKHEILTLHKTESDGEATRKVREVMTRMAEGKYGKKVLLRVEEPDD